MNLILILLFAGCLLAYVYIQHSHEEARNQALYAAHEAVEGAKKKSQEDVLENPADEMEVPETPKKTELVGDKYEDGEIIGTLTYLDTESPLGIGDGSEELEGKAIMHPRSEMAHRIILGHCYRDGSIFGSLWQVKDGDAVTIETSEGTEELKVTGTEWMAEEEYNSEETIRTLFEGENRPSVTLITCMSKDGGKGRLIVSCEPAA